PGCARTATCVFTRTAATRKRSGGRSRSSSANGHAARAPQRCSRLEGCFLDAARSDSLDSIIRLQGLTLAAIALGACATANTSAELKELKDEVRALREENDRLGQRLGMIEAQRTVAAASPKAQASSAAPLEPKTTAEVPSLTVVKLKPKKEAAPRLKTDVEVFEPSADIVAAMKKIEAED